MDNERRKWKNDILKIERKKRCMQPKNTLQKHLTRDYQSMMTCMNTGNEFQHATRETPSVASGLFKDRGNF